MSRREYIVEFQRVNIVMSPVIHAATIPLGVCPKGTTARSVSVTALMGWRLVARSKIHADGNLHDFLVINI